MKAVAFKGCRVQPGLVEVHRLMLLRLDFDDGVSSINGLVDEVTSTFCGQWAFWSTILDCAPHFFGPMAVGYKIEVHEVGVPRVHGLFKLVTTCFRCHGASHDVGSEDGI